MQAQDKKTELVQQIQKLVEETEAVLPKSPVIKELNELKEDIIQDYYTIVVVGEFKNGKSTFVNALLGQHVMPVDVTPTTATIYAVFYGEKKELHVVKRNGAIESIPLTGDVLHEFTASNLLHPEEIKYLRLYLPSKILQNRVVLIDTPGVNDLNQQRAEITHQFLPRADVVIVMLSMTTPVKKTEEEFLRRYLITDQSTDRIIYVANFADRIDEDEMEDVLQRIRHRLETITGKRDQPIYAISALEAAEGKESEDQEMVRYSGILEVEDKIQELIVNGSRNQEKSERFIKRFLFSLERLTKEIETVDAFSKTTMQDLQIQLDATNAWINQQDEWEKQLEDYIQDRKDEILYMVDKSLEHSVETLRREVRNRIDMFHGADAKSLAEQILPVMIRSHFTNWLEHYSEPIHQLLYKLETELAKGLSNSFKQAVEIQAYQKQQLFYEVNIPLFAPNTGNAMVKAGLVVGGAGTVLLMMGGSFLIPLIGMTGLPLLQQKIAENQWKQVKLEFTLAVKRYIDTIAEDFRAQLFQYIIHSLEEIKTQTISRYSEMIEQINNIAQAEMEKQQEHCTTELKKQDNWRTLLEAITALRRVWTKEDAVCTT